MRRGARRGRHPEARRRARGRLHGPDGAHGHRRGGRRVALGAARDGRQRRRTSTPSWRASKLRFHEVYLDTLFGPAFERFAEKRERARARTSRARAASWTAPGAQPPDARHRDEQRPRRRHPRVRPPPLPRRHLGAHRPGRARRRARGAARRLPQRRDRRDGPGRHDRRGHRHQADLGPGQGRPRARLGEDDAAGLPRDALRAAAGPTTPTAATSTPPTTRAWSRRCAGSRPRRRSASKSQGGRGRRRGRHAGADDAQRLGGHGRSARATARRRRWSRCPGTAPPTRSTATCPARTPARGARHGRARARAAARVRRAGQGAVVRRDVPVREVHAAWKRQGRGQAQADASVVALDKKRQWLERSLSAGRLV